MGYDVLWYRAQLAYRYQSLCHEYGSPALEHVDELVARTNVGLFDGSDPGSLALKEHRDGSHWFEVFAESKMHFLDISINCKCFIH